MAQLGQCVYGAADPRLGCCGSVYDLPDDPALGGRTQWVAGVCAEECAALLQNFLREKRTGSQGADGSHAFQQEAVRGRWLSMAPLGEHSVHPPGAGPPACRFATRSARWWSVGAGYAVPGACRHIRPGTNLPEREDPVRLQPPGRPGRHNRRASGCKWAGLANAGKGRPPAAVRSEIHRFPATHGVPPARRRPWPGGILQSGCP